MKFFRIKGNIRLNRKRLFLLGVSITLILLGIFISAENIIKFSRGYFAGKSGKSFQSAVTPEGNESDLTEANNSDKNSNNSDQNSNNRDKDSNNIDKDSNIADKEEPALYPDRPKTGDEIGDLYIPKLDATLPIYEGTDEDELEIGVGHFADSVLPGEKDNCVLSGHRDTVFRNLGDVGEGDSLVVSTSAGEFEYKVSKVRIVDKDDRTVIVPKPRATLTVSTCYPFSYIGSAPQRYILVAYLVSKNPD